MISIAIDGPSGAGKSTIARALAQRLGYLYVDTGALYRTLAYALLTNGVSIEDVPAIVQALPTIEVRLAYVNEHQHVYLGDSDVTGEIRTPKISQLTSKLSAIPEVREHLLSLQRDIATHADVIMDGRDIGTVVLPHAQIKIFLTAEPAIRAARRFDELRHAGVDITYDTVLQELLQRDYRDEHRETAPTKQADDAERIDTSGMSLSQTLDTIEARIRNIIGLSDG